MLDKIIIQALKEDRYDSLPVKPEYIDLKIVYSALYTRIKDPYGETIFYVYGDDIVRRLGLKPLVPKSIRCIRILFGGHKLYKIADEIFSVKDRRALCLCN